MTQKITAIFGAFIFTAILMGTLALAPNAYAGLSPIAVPPSITTSLLPGELGQFPTTIDPQELPQGFTANFFGVLADADCFNSGFFANIFLGPAQIGPTEFDWQWDLQPFLFADPGEYTCTALWSVLYTDPTGFSFSIDVGQLLTVTVLSPTIDVDIDIKPGSDPNSINTRSMGVVPVAILGSDTFDVTNVDVSTLMFGNASPTHDLSDSDTYNEHIQDVNDDGFLDLVSHYKQKEIGIACDDTEATLTADLLDGTTIEGTDSVNPKGC